MGVTNNYYEKFNENEPENIKNTGNRHCADACGNSKDRKTLLFRYSGRLEHDMTNKYVCFFSSKRSFSADADVAENKLL